MWKKKRESNENQVRLWSSSWPVYLRRAIYHLRRSSCYLRHTNFDANWDDYLNRCHLNDYSFIVTGSNTCSAVGRFCSWNARILFCSSQSSLCSSERKKLCWSWRSEVFIGCMWEQEVKLSLFFFLYILDEYGWIYSIRTAAKSNLTDKIMKCWSRFIWDTKA